MNLQDALQFLRDNQPMPHDPSEELLTRYKSVTAYFYQNPDAACIPLFLGSFAEWDDWSVYDSVQTVIRMFPLKQVLPHLCQGLASRLPSVRMWCADTARYFAHATLVELLGNLLLDDIAEIRLAAAMALEKIELPEVVRLAAAAKMLEKDDEVLEVLEQIISNAGSW